MADIENNDEMRNPRATGDVQDDTLGSPTYILRSAED
jgi:hypothetical protein